MVLTWVIVGIVAVIAIIFFTYYNKFIRLTHQINNALAQIDVQLKKRAELVPNLLESVKGYMKHEKKIFSEVTQARKELVGAGNNMETKLKAGRKLQSALKSIFAIAEGYPSLKANENFLHLQQELSAIEDKIAYSRQYYNDGIMSYNVSTTTIPGMWFAGLYRFGKKDYLKIPAEQKVVPKISF